MGGMSGKFTCCRNRCSCDGKRRESGDWLQNRARYPFPLSRVPQTKPSKSSTLAPPNFRFVPGRRPFFIVSASRFYLPRWATSFFWAKSIHLAHYPLFGHTHTDLELKVFCICMCSYEGKLLLLVGPKSASAYLIPFRAPHLRYQKITTI
jgi:hypothetical protein